MPNWVQIYVVRDLEIFPEPENLSQQCQFRNIKMSKIRQNLSKLISLLAYGLVLYNLANSIVFRLTMLQWFCCNKIKRTILNQFSRRSKICLPTSCVCAIAISATLPHDMLTESKHLEGSQPYTFSKSVEPPNIHAPSGWKTTDLSKY